jgi:hypothetical protein
MKHDPRTTYERARGYDDRFRDALTEQIGTTIAWRRFLAGGS